MEELEGSRIRGLRGRAAEQSSATAGQGRPRPAGSNPDLTQKMLQSNPSKRITAKEALYHAYFNDLPKEVLSLYSK